jgi:hypothetical protein
LFLIDDYFPLEKDGVKDIDKVTELEEPDKVKEMENTLKSIPVVRLFHLCEVEGYAKEFKR